MVLRQFHILLHDEHITMLKAQGVQISEVVRQFVEGYCNAPEVEQKQLLDLEKREGEIDSEMAKLLLEKQKVHGALLTVKHKQAEVAKQQQELIEKKLKEKTQCCVCGEGVKITPRTQYARFGDKAGFPICGSPTTGCYHTLTHEDHKMSYLVRASKNEEVEINEEVSGMRV